MTATWKNSPSSESLNLSSKFFLKKYKYLDDFWQFYPKYCKIFSKNLQSIWLKIFQASKILQLLKMNQRWRQKWIFRQKSSKLRCYTDSNLFMASIVYKVWGKYSVYLHLILRRFTEFSRPLYFIDKLNMNNGIRIIKRICEVRISCC